EPHHEQRVAERNAETLALADGEMRNALMLTQYVAVEIDDLAGRKRIRLQAADDVGVAARRHEADVLAVMLVGDRQAKTPRQLAHLRLGHVAERKSDEIK